MKLPLAYYGHPILRQKGARIDEITAEIRQLVDDMIETMDEKDGIGIAAPQVHHSFALFITRVPTFKGMKVIEDGEEEEEDWEPGEIRIFINPKILNYSEDKAPFSEGCLSIPKINADVYRPVKITIQAIGLDGKEFTEEFEDLAARVFMHENDHVNGVLFIDRLHEKERQRIEPQLKALKKKLAKRK